MYPNIRMFLAVLVFIGKTRDRYAFTSQFDIVIVFEC